MFSEWLERPRLRAGGDVEERSATWLELFYDLVFVVTVAELVGLLSAGSSPPSVFAYVALFVPVWWGWIGSTFYATRFDTDDLAHRLMTAVELFAVVALAVNVHGAFGETSRGFALAYAVLRGVLVIKYIGASRAVPEARPLTIRYARGFGLDAGLWFASVFVPLPYRFGLWALGLLVSFGTPITAGSLHGELPPHASHLPERFGLFTIIVLGESVVGLVHGASEQTFSLLAFLVGAFCVAVVFSLWWIYFDNLDGAAIRAAVAAGRTADYQRWLYAHFPLAVGLAAVGVGIDHLLVADPALRLPAADRWLLCGALAVVFSAIGLIHRTTDACANRPVRTQSLHRFGGAGAVLVVAVLGGPLTPFAVAGVLVVICVTQVILDLRERESTAEFSVGG
ncbi:low temperature requirement protein A [Halococcus hamelinensis]|uniref:low temperature requirement protein A n=1 Tax=Halococcus hamelinensis TaxID=332168 RepID=UPI000ADCA397|nr:low temperature requirement protein A [Halococcus hamelinensis]